MPDSLAERHVEQILYRFLHHAEVVQMNGRSYRLRDRAGSSAESPADSKPAKAPSGSEGSHSGSKPAKAPSGSGEPTEESA